MKIPRLTQLITLIVPCIALTGFEQRFPEARAIGFDAYLRKPVDLARLCNIASSLIARVQP